MTLDEYASLTPDEKSLVDGLYVRSTSRPVPDPENADKGWIAWLSPLRMHATKELAKEASEQPPDNIVSLSAHRASKEALVGVNVATIRGNPCALAGVCKIPELPGHLVAVHTPDKGTVWGLDPDQADALACELVRMAEQARSLDRQGGE